ncbi:MAG: hypothetical protein J0H35_08505 [Rhodospirillales bacterium]|nr:hypothetical protein [Rhodospirillales bacterium]
MSETAPPAIGLFDAIHTARAQRRLRPDPVPDALITQEIAFQDAPTQGPAVLASGWTGLTAVLRY